LPDCRGLGFEKGTKTMSLSRMNAEEKAAYFIGLAVVRQLEHAPRDPETEREINAISRWIEHWLTADEYAHVVQVTAYDFAEQLSRDEPLDPTPPRSPGDDDDVPF
jgi:hypothetical protein